MKKLLLFVSVVMILAGQAFAGPVDVNTAKALGAKYLRNNVLSAKNVADVEHVYTLKSENETPYLYVFNYENGYVVVAADDRACPILGYAEGGVFDVNNIPDGLKYYLGHYGRQIQYAIDNELVAEEEIVEQWELLRKEGIIMKTRMNKAVTPLLSTTWDQGWPYNYYAPSCSSYWTNNHCYAGCVATSMSQQMKYWNWPNTGVGEHSYSTSSYGGTLSANFGNATYNWSIMPNSLGSSANEAAMAVALIMYHCGIAVDMDYSPNGSGAHTEDVPDAVIQHFRYGTCTNLKYRDNYTRTQWEDMLIASFDRGIPVMYSGSGDDGGHAFNCDGYNDQRYFHFNWGWSGSSNNYYQIDALNTGNGSFNQYQRVVFDMIPDYIYESMVPAIQTMNATVANAMSKTVTISFTVPTISESGAALSSIEKITLKRNGTTIKTFNNPQPGDALSYDDNLADYGCYEYTISGENNGLEGKLFSQVALVGPNCTWKLICTTPNFQGWNGGKLQFYSSNGTLFKEVSMTNSSPLSDKFQMPEGNITIKWYAPTTTVSSMTISLKNSAGQQVYNFSGASTQLNGTLYTGNNDCEGCTAPTNFTGEYIYQGGADGTRLTWACDYDPSNFKIYRSDDGVNYSEIEKIGGDLREYFDGVNVAGTYYYRVTAFSSACESTPAMTADGEDFVITEVLAVLENTINARIYPNPANGVLMVQADGIKEVTVFNALGQKVYQYNGLTDALDVNTGAFESGVYMIGVKTVDGEMSNRFVIMH